MKNFIALIFIISSFSAVSQVRIDTIFSEPGYSEQFLDAYEKNPTELIISGGSYSSSQILPRILSLNFTGNNLNISKLYADNEDYYPIDILHFTDFEIVTGILGNSTLKNKIRILKFDTAFNYLSKKDFTLFPENTVIQTFNSVVNSENEIVICGTYAVDAIQNMFIFKMSSECDSLFFKDYELNYNQQYEYDFDPIPHSKGYLVCGYNFFQNDHGDACEIVKLNPNFEIDSVFTPKTANPYDYLWGNSSIKFLTDTTFIWSGRKILSKKDQDEDISVFLYDTSFNKLKEISFGLQNVDEYSPYRSIDYKNPGSIYVGGISPISWHYDTPCYFMLSKIDSNFNIVWTKFYGGTNDCNELDKVFATSDGGCLMLGRYYPPQQSSEEKIIKVDENGILTNSENNTPSIMQKDVILFPNPVINNLNIKKGNQVQNAKISVYNFNGEIVGAYDLTENDMQINLSNLSSGTYFYKITSGTKIVDKGSFIKQ